MLRKRVVQVAVVVAAALALGGCAPKVRASFRSIELVPVTSSGSETVADLQVIGDKKVIGVAKGPVPKGDEPKRRGLVVKAIEQAIASAPGGADVLVALNWFEVRENETDMTFTVIGYPARYKNFRRDEASARNKTPYSVKQLPGGLTVVSYDKNAFTAELANDRIIAITAIQGGGAAKVRADAAAAAHKAPETPVNATGESVAPTTPSTTDKTGE